MFDNVIDNRSRMMAPRFCLVVCFWHRHVSPPSASSQSLLSSWPTTLFANGTSLARDWSAHVSCAAMADISLAGSVIRLLRPFRPLFRSPPASSVDVSWNLGCGLMIFLLLCTEEGVMGRVVRSVLSYRLFWHCQIMVKKCLFVFLQFRPNYLETWSKNYWSINV